MANAKELKHREELKRLRKLAEVVRHHISWTPVEQMETGDAHRALVEIAAAYEEATKEPES